IKRVSTITGYVNIRTTVVVVIRYGNAHAPALACESSGFSNVSKLEIGALMVKRDHGTATLAEAIDGGSVYRDDVEFAITIAVDQSGASAHRFNDIFLVGRRDVRNRQARFFGNVFESWEWGRAGWRTLYKCQGGGKQKKSAG